MAESLESKNPAVVEKNPAAVELGRLGGGAKHAKPVGLAALPKKRRLEISRQGAAASAKARKNGRKPTKVSSPSPK